jgi:hypothetical protein
VEDPVVLTLDVLPPPVLEWETFEDLVKNEAAPNVFQFLDPKIMDDECNPNIIIRYDKSRNSEIQIHI